MAEKTQILFLWKQIRDKAEGIIPPVSFNTFIKDLEPVDIANRRLLLKAPTDLAANTIMKKHAVSLRDAIAKSDVGINDFRLVVEGSDTYTADEDEDVIDDFKPVPVNKNFTFDFHRSSLVQQICLCRRQVGCRTPGRKLQPPLYLRGIGAGKNPPRTGDRQLHRAEIPRKTVLYTTCENFLNEFIDSMISGKISSRDKGARFRLHYRNVDILMIDDIQFLAKKPGVQEEFFHTFNELSSQNKQIVLTSDRPPKEIATLEERLRTRFEGGLIADIQPPDLETKIAILKRKALERKSPMPDDVLEFLANDSGHDVRTLEGRLTKVLFASKLHEEPISLNLAKLALSESVNEGGTSSEEITPDVIISSVCGYYKYKRDDLLGKGKKADLVKARQICAYLMCRMLTLPLMAIGNVMGGRDHTTIMYSRDKVEELVKLNEKMAKEVDDIKNIILKQ